MPYRKVKFVNDSIYHIIIRGIEGNLLFRDVDDYYRGIFSIYEFNTTKPVVIRERRAIRAKIKKILKETGRDPNSILDSRDKLVAILAFCFMPNHIHLLLRQLKEGGITKFMNKLGSGYGGYFNKKHKHKGHVFQDRFESVLIKTDNQLRIVFTYIHTNPVSLVEPNWKKGIIRSSKKSTEFLGNYKWSSYLDYIGEKNFPSVTERQFMLEFMDKENDCRQIAEDWIKYKGQIKDLAELVLE